MLEKQRWYCLIPNRELVRLLNLVCLDREGLGAIAHVSAPNVDCRGLSHKCCSHVVRLEGVVIVNLDFLLKVLLVRRAGASVVAAPELGDTLDPFGLVCGGGGRHGSSACTNTGGGGSSEREAGTGRGGP